MLAELGTFALIIALCLTIIQAGFPLIGTLRRSYFLDGAGRIAVLVSLGYFLYQSRATTELYTLLIPALLLASTLTVFSLLGTIGKYYQQVKKLSAQAYIIRAVLLIPCLLAILYSIFIVGFTKPLVTTATLILSLTALTNAPRLRRNLFLNGSLTFAVIASALVGFSTSIIPAFVIGRFFSPATFGIMILLLIILAICLLLLVALLVIEICGNLKDIERLKGLSRYSTFLRMPLLIATAIPVLMMIVLIKIVGGYYTTPNIIALTVITILIVVPLLHRQIYGYHFAELTRSAGLGQFVFTLLALGILVTLFVNSDFSVRYVAENSNTALPLLYKVTAVWGAHEGSFLLMTLVLSAWTTAVILFSRNLPALYAARIISIMGLISIGFLLFGLITSNPFTPIYWEQVNFAGEFWEQLKRVLENAKDPSLAAVLNKFEISAESPVSVKFIFGNTGIELFTAFKDYNLSDYYTTFRRFVPEAEGKDLNPLLQDMGQAIHPPLLYVGYVGFSVAFSFSIASLMGGKLDSAWARWSRPWSTIAWAFLTLGIMLGSWWAYYELGWGDWWFWDPVENSSFIPWVVGTALIHSLAVTEKRGSFQSWTVILSIIAFSLSLLGTFLVRSGVLNSVHSFASDPERGVFLLIFLTLIIGGSLILYAFQAPKIKSIGRFSGFSKETFLLVNNIILIAVAATILWGTLYPIISNGIQDRSISVGPPWFNLYFIPLMLLLALLMPLGPMVNWKKHDPKKLLMRVLPYAVASILVGVVFYLTVEKINWLIAICITIATWVTLGSLEILFYRIRRMKTLGRALSSLSASSIGSMVAHIGIAVFIIGAAFAGINSIKKTEKLAPGQSYTVNGIKFEFVSTRFVEGPNYNAYEAKFNIYDKGKVFAVYPQKRFYLKRTQLMTEAGIHWQLNRDLVISMGKPLNTFVKNFYGQAKHELTQARRDHVAKLLKTTSWPITIKYKPFMRLTWLGAIIMAFGGLIATLDKRYRLFSRKKLATMQAPATDAKLKLLDEKK